MSSTSKTQQTESFIEPFSHSAKSPEAPLTHNEGHGQESVASKEPATISSQTFSKSFLQPLDKDAEASQAVSSSSGEEDANVGVNSVEVKGANDVTERMTSSQDVYPHTELTGELAYGLYDGDNDVVLLVGGGHLSKEVARLAHYVGFTVDVIDTRQEYLQEGRFPNARKVVHCSDYAQICDMYTIGSRHSLVILSHTYETDFLVLSNVVHSAARYIGVAGSDRKKQSLFSELRKKGVPATELACVSCPIGVAIGASSPEEMALSIVAELVAARAGCLLPHLSRRSS